MKKTTHILFTIYIFLVIWIILFKLSVSIDQLPHFRSINERTVFLGFLLSLSLELSQYIFCIGASDITDLIMNTTGVLVGVGLYYLLKKIFKEKTNKIILALAAIVTILFVSLIIIILINN